MRILCLIDSLGSGGAQRQLVTLAIGMKNRGHEVRFLTYHRENHFLPLLQEAQIPCHIIEECSRLKRVFAVRRVLRQGTQDVVLAFLEAPCLYAELARTPTPKWGLVAGERSANPRMRKGAIGYLRQAHRLANFLVANSHTNRLMLEQEWPFLQSKLITIYNTVDLNLFKPTGGNEVIHPHRSDRPFRIVVAGSYQKNKNMLGLSKALLHLKGNGFSQPLLIDWYGGMPADKTHYISARRFVDENHLSEFLRFHPTSGSIQCEFANADAVGLFSFFEGLPNVICEGMACGKPILLSNVCDAGNLVKDGENGFLCDPHSPESIAGALRRVAILLPAQRALMGLRSRQLAEHLFPGEAILEKYERLLQESLRPTSQPNMNWPPEVPDSAVETVARWSGIPPRS